MATAVVTIAGRTYRMSFAAGEEPRLEALARSVEEKIDVMRANFGDIGEQRIVVMAAIAIADEAADARERARILEAETDVLKANLAVSRDTAKDFETRVIADLNHATRRIQQIAADLQKPVAPRPEFP